MYTAVGASIFAGGFTYGMQSEFQVVAHFEDGMFGVDTFKRNEPGIPVYTDRQRWPTRDYQVDVVFANPACSVWSICGRTLFTGKDNWKTDRNLQGSIDAMNLVFSMRPKIFALESVSLLATRGREFLLQFAGAVSEIGYNVTLFHLDPKLWGLPQQRRRVFLIAHRIELGAPQLPPAYHYAVSNLTYPKQTVDMALSRVLDPGFIAPMVKGYDEVLAMGVKEGEQLARVWERAHHIGVREGMGTGQRLRGRPSFSAHRVKGYEPCDSIIGSSQAFIHPHEDRFLGSNELSALCGFPTWWTWPNSSQAGGEIGKGVTVTAARVLAQYLRRALDENAPLETTGVLTTYDYRAKSQRLGDYSCRAARTVEQLVRGETQVLAPTSELTA